MYNDCGGRSTWMVEGEDVGLCVDRHPVHEACHILRAGNV